MNYSSQYKTHAFAAQPVGGGGGGRPHMKGVGMLTPTYLAVKVAFSVARGKNIKIRILSVF